MHTNGTRIKNFHIFGIFFSKVCRLGAHTFWDFLWCMVVQMVQKKLRIDFSVLISNIECFMDVCMGVSKKRHFSYIKEQRIFHQIIYLAKNKGFLTKSPKYTFSHKKHEEFSCLIFKQIWITTPVRFNSLSDLNYR